MGPALLPESLERLRPAELLSVITRGRQATQMAGFGTAAGGPLQPAEIAALAAWVRSPVVPAPQWTDADVRASRVDGPRHRPTSRPGRSGRPTR
jgi:mono/diheme cytochrome c family protein